MNKVSHEFCDSIEQNHGQEIRKKPPIEDKNNSSSSYALFMLIAGVITFSPIYSPAADAEEKKEERFATGEGEIGKS